MNRPRTLAASFVLLIAGALTLSMATAALAAPRPGGKCSKAGAVVHVGNTDLRCKKKSGKLVWVKLARPSGDSSGAAVSSTGIASGAAIPKVVKNWGLDLRPYDPATGRAGVMQIAGVTPPTFGDPADDAMYSHIVGLYGAEVKGIKEPQMAFIAPLGTPVISMVDGTVCDLPLLYSGDHSVRVAPKGTACVKGGAPVLFEHEHLIAPLVKVGDVVSAGQRIGTVSDYNPYWKAKGMGMIETGVFFMKNDSTGRPWHACLASSLSAGTRDSMLATLTSIENAWNAERADPTLYSLAAQNPVGCLTSEDITDAAPA
jgi:hypothetical protein